jgi:lysyl-tRNA synthetase class 1
MSQFHVDPEAVIIERRKKEGQFNLKSKDKHWGEVIAEKLIEKTPNPKDGIYTCAAGITPSGMVHFGNFREIMTNWPVVEALKARGKKARLIFSWDDYDRFRKVPTNVPENYSQYLGLPVSQIPSPENPNETYAEHFKKALEDVIQKMGIEIEFKHQGELYPTGQYADLISKALNQKDKIADILWAFMSEKSQAQKESLEKYKTNFWPGTVYSSFTGKDNTKILEFDGKYGITYKCLDSDKTETIDIRKQAQLKLGWKIDWPMRWAFEGVNFEPGGKDHSTYGGSYDVASVIAREIFEIEPPFYQAYGFINIKGNEGKMSSSKGNALTPSELLEVYELPILKWVYTRSMPKKEFDLAFDSDLIRLYDEYDRTVAKIDKIDQSKANGLKLAIQGINEDRLKNPASFRQLTGWAQIVDWDEQKLTKLFQEQDLNYNQESIHLRLENAKNWMEQYNQEELLELLQEPNQEYISQMTQERKQRVTEMKNFLQENQDLKIDDINHKMYEIPKDGNENIELEEKKSRQKDFFQDIYMLLLNQERGPRLSTFLWALDRKQVIKLLSV